MKVRLTTFNCENLFGRYRILDKASATDTGARKTTNYPQSLQVYEVVALSGRKNQLKPAPIAKIQRTNTAAAIVGALPDVLCVNEVENLATLRVFNALYLKNYFDRLVLVNGRAQRLRWSGHAPLCLGRPVLWASAPGVPLGALPPFPSLSVGHPGSGAMIALRVALHMARCT
jgi:hypothetical protein